MGGALEAATRQYFDFVDRKDAEAIIGAGTEDIQAESGTWKVVLFHSVPLPPEEE